MADFKRSLAVVIGINEYQDYPKLQTARYDAERLAEILAIEHKYDYVILVADETYKEYRQGQELPVQNKYQPTLNGLLDLLGKRLPSEINPTKEDRLLFYFAGHGIPDDSDEGPKGYLVPLDADSKKRGSLLPMQELYERLAALNCRHFLVVLDCCFAGRFSWSSTRKGRTFPKVIHKEHYDRFINSPAWQAITSASHDQEAFDILEDDNRGTVEGTNHSPFAEGLFKALQGEADVIPAGKNGQPAGDGVITATELYLYLREHVEIGSKERQTPGLWSLPKHERGEYIFLVPGANPNLKPAPNVNKKNNPYRGLESFDEEHSRFFFGREELIEQLSERISTPKQPLTVVLGVSGSGKSSLVKAGLIPRLKNPSRAEVSQANPINTVHQWRILNPMRPGESPFTALTKTILTLADVTGSNQPDILNFLNVSNRLDNLTFITEVLKQKVNDLDRKLVESSSENGEESAETLRLKKEVEKFISIAKGWHQSTEKAKQLLIVEHFEELYALCRNPAEQQQLQQAVSDCLNPLSQRLQSNPNQLIDIVRAWSQNNPGVRLLLTIDQFEELITLSQSKQKDKQNSQQQQQKKLSKQPTQEVQQENKQEEWQQFLNLLEKALSANLEQLRIIVTLRSDFEPRFLNSDALKSYWTKARFPVRAMRSDELRQAIERPAAEMALYFEPPSLVDKLIDEVGQMPGALPLLSFTLSELYIKLAEKWRIQETSDRALTLDADFDTEGGVAGSLTRRANQEYDDLPDDAHRVTLRRVMLRMVTFEGGELARRRVPLSELEYADATENERIKLVLEQFNHARLIVSGQEKGEPYVEPTHDFLVRGWTKLQQWQEQTQKLLSIEIQRRLTQAANDWHSTNQKREQQGLLWNNDPRLALFEQMIAATLPQEYLEKGKFFEFLIQQLGKRIYQVLQTQPEIAGEPHQLNQQELEFVLKSVNLRHERLGQIIGVLTLTSAVLIFITIFALIGQRNAVIAQIRANQQASYSALLSNQQLEALVNALRAGKTLESHPLLQVFKPDAQLRNLVTEIVYQAMTKTHEYNRLEGHQDSINNASFSPNGEYIVTASNDNTARMWTLRGELVAELKGHQKRLNNAMFSSNGEYIVTASDDSAARVWTLRGELVAELKGHQKRLNNAMFSSNGEYIVTASNDNTARVWTLRGELVAELKGHQKRVNNAMFSPKGEYIVTASNDNTARVWTLKGELVAKLKGHQKWVNRAIFSPNERYIVTASDDNTARVWNLQGKLVAILQGHQNPVKRVIFSPNGQYIVTASDDNTARVWNLQGKLVAILQGHQNSVTSVAFSHNGQYIVTASDDNTARVWNLQGKSVAILQGHQNPITSATFSPNGQYIVTASGDRTARVWNIQEGGVVVTMQGHQNSVTSAAFSHNGQYIVTASDDNTARVWNLQGKLVAILQGHQNPITSATFSPNGQYIVTASYDNTARVWTFQGGLVAELRGDQNPITSATFSHNGQYIVTASYDNTARVSNLQGKLVATLQGHQNPIRSATFSPNGQYIVTASEDNTARMWNLQGKLVATLQGHQNPITSATFSPNGQYIVTASEDNSARVWNLQGKLIATLQGHQNSVTSAAFSPNGQYIVTASGDRTARVWNLQGKLVAILQGHQNPITSATFSPDSQYIVTASYDNTARVWAFQGGLVAELRGHQKPVTSAVFSPDGQSILTASADNTARVWPFRQLHGLLSLGCQRVHDYLKYNSSLKNKEDVSLCDGS